MFGPEIEITELPPLEASQCSLIQMHSVLNVMNVLRGELTLIGLAVADNSELLADALRHCDDVTASLRSFDHAVDSALHLEDHLTAIQADIQEHTASCPVDVHLADSLENLEAVYAILRVRSREVLARSRAGNAWSAVSLADLTTSLSAVFKTQERNSRGRYSIAFNCPPMTISEYHISFSGVGDNGLAVMPAAFADVICDLLANARKYSTPGSRITARLRSSDGMLSFVVQDNGRGIPDGEIHRVFQFGERASNVLDVRTRGGGFGLTKALLITKQFGGRLFIASRCGVGTRIRIEIPTPATMSRAA